MSLPRTQAEKDRFQQTRLYAGMTENVVSTACPSCAVRFAVLANLASNAWHLRCTCCGWRGIGELKGE